VVKDENQDRREFVADSRIKNPEQIYIAKETHEEIHHALQMLEPRDRTYLWYRFGFEDDMEHPLNETAKHFHLSESRAKATEKLALDNFWLELPWWY
jgi:RNA polymerase primary sigma factor/RNA polymerase sporulation-specific sigma factor